MTTWRDRLQPASFRGVPFDVEADSIGVGRRTQTHEFVNRDKPYVEDLGRATREPNLTGFLVGDDCFEQADRLIAAFEAEGPAELVHPWLGRMKVSIVGKATFKRDRREGGVIRFEASYVEAGELSFPATTANTSQQVARAADAMKAASKSNFATLLERINAARVGIASCMAMASRVYSVFSDQLSPFADLFTDAADFARQLINAPSFFVEELFSTLDAVKYSFTGTASALMSVAGLLSGIRGLDDGPAAQGADALALQEATVQLAQDVLLIDAMRTLATVDVPVVDAGTPRDPVSVVGVGSQTGTPAVEYDEAGDAIVPVDTPVVDDVIAVRDGASDLIWDMGLDTSYERFQALTGARQAIVRHLNAIAKNGVRIVTIQPLEPTASLVLAYRHYGDATRADEVVARNRVRHPGFVPATELQIAER
ncbi:DNA circulation family protein [Burkholderia multivorans]